MTLRQYPTATQYLAENQALLEQHEALNSLLLGLALDNSRKENDDGLYLSISHEGEIFFTGLQTGGRNLIVYGDPLQQERFTPLLVNYLQQHQIDLPGIIGPKNLALALGKSLANKLGWRYEVVFKQLVYELTSVKHIPTHTGELRQASLQDLDTVSTWMHQFLIEALNEDDREATHQNALKKISNGEVYLWQTTSAVSMCCIARPTQHGISINYVYTPEEYRKKGYGTKVVAELSHLMLTGGAYRFCTLFTDMDNPTSNDIYQRIGYEPIGEFRVIQFSH